MQKIDEDRIYDVRENNKTMQTRPFTQTFA